jgi:hypothetical protein
MGHVDLYVGNTMLTVGQDYFLHSYFSTVAYQAGTYTHFVTGEQ